MNNKKYQGTPKQLIMLCINTSGLFNVVRSIYIYLYISKPKHIPEV